MIDHRCKTYDPAIFITEKCYIFIMIILVSLQDRDQYLHGKLFRHFRMLLQKISFKNISIIIKHLAIVYIIIYIYLFIWIFPEKLQKIQKGFPFFIGHGYCRSVVKIFFIYCLIPFTDGQFIPGRRHKIFINDR